MESFKTFVEFLNFLKIYTDFFKLLTFSRNYSKILESFLKLEKIYQIFYKNPKNLEKLQICLENNYKHYSILSHILIYL